MAEGSPTCCVLVGAGSIGCAHARAIASRYELFVVVDPSSAALTRAAGILGGRCHGRLSLEEVAAVIRPIAMNCTAIIANWGPDHAQTFGDLVEIGVPRIIIEKPMAHSAKAARAMAALAQERGTRALVGTARRYSGFVPFVQDHLSSIREAPQLVVVHGGAMCTVTNGMHWLDFASAIFGEMPSAVTAMVENAHINPRSPDLGYWGGTVTWAFPDSRQLVITLSNQSSVSNSVSIYTRSGRVDMDDTGCLWVGTRDAQAIASDARVTRYGPASPVTKIGPFVPARAPILEMLDILESTQQIEPPLTIHASLLEAMMASLYSAENGATISLPLTPEDPAFSREWPAS